MVSGTHAPGPSGHMLLGSLPELRRDPLGFLTDCARTYGDVVRYRVVNVNAFLVNHPDHVEYVLVSGADRFQKGRMTQAARVLVGNGVLLSEGEFWKRQRRLVQPAFHRERIDAYGEIMVAYARRMIAGWRDGETRDIYADMKRLALEIVARTLFDVDITAEADDIGAALETFQERFHEGSKTAFLIPLRIPTPGNLRLRRAVRRLETVIDRIIARRRAGAADAGDLLSILLAARDENGVMSDRQVRDEVMTFLLAGHATTALALSWALYLLAQCPEAQDKLAAEFRAVLGSKEPAIENLPQLRYTEMVVKEAMRLYPPVWGVPRVALQDCVIGGYHIPAGASVSVSQWVMHRDPRYYTDPEAFIPGRWSEEFARRLPRFAYFPFSGGPRVCLGQAFAMMETVMLLAVIATQFRIRLAPGERVTPWPAFTLEPQDGIKLVVSNRTLGRLEEES